MEEVVPKMARQRGSDARQSRRRRVRSFRGCPQTLQEDFFFVLSCIGRRTRESCDRGSEIGTGHSGRDGEGQFLRGNRRNLAEAGVVRKISFPRRVASMPNICTTFHHLNTVVRSSPSYERWAETASQLSRGVRPSGRPPIVYLRPRCTSLLFNIIVFFMINRLNICNC